MSVGLIPYALAGAVVAVFGLTWRQPNLSLGMGWVLFFILAGLLWKLWEPRRLSKILWPWVLLLFFWLSGFLAFLFFETTFSRLLWMLLLAVGTWWYTAGWLVTTTQSIDLNRGAGLTATVAMAWLVLFFSGAATVGWLVFLSANFWLLSFFYFFITLITFLSVGWVAGWSWRGEWIYLLVALVIQMQAFMVASWWPTNFYLISWLLSSIFLAMYMFTRYDTGVAVPRQTLIRNLLWLSGLSIILIISSRWV